MDIIGVCGYGYTGSGAVIDLLKEYSSINCFDDFEFSLVYIPDGVLDLDYHLNEQPCRFMSSDVAITRFIEMIKKRNRENGYERATNGNFYKLSMNYVQSITQIEWRGFWNYDYYYSNILIKNLGFKILFRRVLQKMENRIKIENYYPYRKMHFAISPSMFENKTKKYIRDVIYALFQEQENVQTVVLNQPFPANNPSLCFRFFDNPKAIVVDRDPRDMYIFVKKVAKAGGAWIPTSQVNDFISYYRALHSQIQESKNVIRVRFEDLIYKYDNTVKKIEDFLSISEKMHTSKYKHFNPKESICNVQLFNRYDEYTDDVRIIERELSEYLYDFTNLEMPNNMEPIDK